MLSGAISLLINTREMSGRLYPGPLRLGWSFYGPPPVSSDRSPAGNVSLIKPQTVAFIGALSNVTTLTEKYHWLAWINGTSFGKKVLQGVISGILPPVLLALLMELVPFILRRKFVYVDAVNILSLTIWRFPSVELAAFEGFPSRTEVEINLMTRYFLFLVIVRLLHITWL